MMPRITGPIALMPRPAARMLVACVLGLGALALGGCHHKATRAEDQRSASGQVLQGSASDAMLPYDTTRSQPPVAPRTVEHGVSDAAPVADSAASSEEQAAPAPDAAAPAPPPAN